MDSLPPTNKPELPKTRKNTSIKELLKLFLAVFLGLAIPCGYYLVTQYNEYKRTHAAELAELQRPHDEVTAMLNNFEKNAKDLPRCPVIYPLLDKKNHVNSLGSYLSYLAMYQASFLPEEEFNTSVIGEIFQTYALFETKSSDLQKYYRDGMKMDFQAKDFCDGNWVKNSKGYKLTIHFWGSHPEQKFKKQFNKKDLHLAPSWIASCLHEWVGFKDTPAQAACLAQPAYASDADLIKAANVESMRRYCPALICGWEKVVQNNPDSSRVFGTQVGILDDQMHGHGMAMVKARLDQFPQDDFLKYLYVDELTNSKMYEEANKVNFTLLIRDADNERIYGQTIHNLETWGFNEEAARLTKIWCDRHPENPEAWIKRAIFYREYAWVARGSGWATSVTAANWQKMKERMGTAVLAGRKAIEVAPLFSGSWSANLCLGTGAEFKPELMETYFQKAIQLNPANLEPYGVYLNYQLPKWFGTDVIAFEFTRQYWKKDPKMVYDAATETFWDYDEVHTDAERRAQMDRMTKNVKTSPYLPIFNEGMKAYFQQHPYDTKKWADYIYWMFFLDKRDETLAYAKKVIPKDNPEYKIIYPMIILNTLSFEETYVHKITYPQSTNYQLRPDVIALRGEALRGLVQADPDNMNYWNRLAQFDVEHEFFKEAKKCFKAIRDQRDNSVWNQFRFNQALKRVKEGLK